MAEAKVIARDESCEDNLLDWWSFKKGLTPDLQVTCAPDEAALVVKDGTVRLLLEPGRHLLSPQTRPGVADLFGGNVLVHLVFAWTKNFTLPFSGPAGTVTDPRSKESFDAFIVGGCGLTVLSTLQLVQATGGDPDFDVEGAIEKALLDGARMAFAQAMADGSFTAESVADGEDLPDEVIAMAEKEANAHLRLLGVEASLDGDLAITDEDPADEDEDDEEEDSEEDDEDEVAEDETDEDA